MHRAHLPLLVATLCLPVIAGAEPLRFSGSLSATSNYFEDGISQTDDRPAVQLYLDLEKNGIYGTLFLSNADIDGAKSVLELGAGYRGEVTDRLSYDIGYLRYIYFPTDDQSGEVTLALEYDAADRLSLEGEVTYDLTETAVSAVVGAGFELTDRIGLFGEYGQAEAAEDRYWQAGVTYAPTETVDLSAVYHDTPDSGAKFEAVVTYNFATFGN